MTGRTYSRAGTKSGLGNFHVYTLYVTATWFSFGTSGTAGFTVFEPGTALSFNCLQSSDSGTAPLVSGVLPR